MEYIEIELLRQSDKSTVQLVREKEGGQVFVRKRLKGRREVYETLKNCPHPGLPKLYEVELSDEETTVIEEYIRGQTLGSEQLSEPQLRKIVKELCSVLGMLHGKGVIHRDLKPSNILLDEDGHIRLIDFDAARIPRDGRESDTRLLGTRGYAPPEQYGFAQTDVRTDIYALGVTLEQIFGDKAQKPHYRRVFQKCKRLDPKKRYQSVQQAERAFFHRNRSVWYGAAALLLLFDAIWLYPQKQEGSDGQISPVVQAAPEKDSDKAASLTALPAPENPRWNGDTGIALWDAVPDADSSGDYGCHWELYWEKTAQPPDVHSTLPVQQGDMAWSHNYIEKTFVCQVNVSKNFQKNGYYFFAVSAKGDGVQYEDSPYVISDLFEYTGEDAPSLPDPVGLEWKVSADDSGRYNCYAVWENLDAYEDTDSFQVRVYNASGEFAGNNIWSKADILSIGQGGIWIDPKMLTKEGSPYRFTVQVCSSRPNKYRSTDMPDPVPEEYFSPWYDVADQKAADGSLSNTIS